MHRQVTTVLLVLGVASFMALGCADRFQSITTKRAATDFQCSETEIQVEEKQSTGFYGEFQATGCGQTDIYYTNCSLFGVCETRSSAEQAAYNAEIEEQQAAYEAARASAPPPASSSSSSPAPSSSSSSSSSSSLPSNCGFDSDCGPGVKCNSGRCANTEGSSCGFDSHCGGNGAKCNSGKCSTAPDGKCSFDSECPGGSCSSGKCRF